MITTLDINGKNIAGIGITNQRETTVVWDAETGEPLYNAIVWQDRRTAELCDKLKAGLKSVIIHKKTGLLIDAKTTVQPNVFFQKHIILKEIVC